MRFFFLIIFFQLGLSAQAQFFKEIYAGFDLKNKYEYNKVLLPSKYSIDEHIDAKTLFSSPITHIFLGVMHKNKYGIELGFFNELYYAGRYTRTPDGIICGGSISVDFVYHYYLKLRYMIYKYKKFSIYPEVSFIYGSATYWDGDEFKLIGPGCKEVYFKDYDEKGVDWGLNKYYLFLNGNLKMEYRFKKKYSVTASIGYNQGFKPIGYARGYYIYKDEPESKQYFKSEGRGTNLYLTVGLKYHYKVNKPKESILKGNDNNKYRWDNNFHFYAGIISSLDFIDDNLSIKYLPKFGVSFEVRKNRLAITSNLYYLNRKINYFDIINEKNSYDHTNNTTSLLDIYIDFRGVEFNQALNYYYYLSRKLDLYGGVGYFRLNINIKRDQMDIKHSDGHEVTHIRYLGNLYDKSGWLLNLGGIFKINRKVRLNSSFDIKNMHLYRMITRFGVLRKDQKSNPVLSLNLKIIYDL